MNRSLAHAWRKKVFAAGLDRDEECLNLERLSGASWRLVPMEPGDGHRNW
jgi:hypothetical protein